ncbi:MAG: hypothetical protein V7603_709 [Micromonosporaceae bacterium]
MPTIERLDRLADLVERAGAGRQLYVRWSRGPDDDVPRAGGADQSSRDTLTGLPLPGLSANSLRVESWWGGRPVRLWVARRLYDYRHLREARGPGVRPWVLEGDESGRGPDNEPLVICRRPVAWIGEAALRESDEIVAEQGAREWGPLDRR